MFYVIKFYKLRPESQPGSSTLHKARHRLRASMPQCIFRLYPVPFILEFYITRWLYWLAKWGTHTFAWLACELLSCYSFTYSIRGMSSGVACVAPLLKFKLIHLELLLYFRLSISNQQHNFKCVFRSQALNIRLRRMTVKWSCRLIAVLWWMVLLVKVQEGKTHDKHTFFTAIGARGHKWPDCNLKESVELF